MQVLLFSCLVLVLVLAVTEDFLSSAHMIPDERLSNTVSHSLDTPTPPVVIVELPKSAKKNKRPKKQKKTKFSVKKRPPPPADCVPVGGSCKPPGVACCDYCAFCQCRLFRTVCYCRMGNPRC